MKKVILDIVESVVRNSTIVDDRVNFETKAIQEEIEDRLGIQIPFEELEGIMATQYLDFKRKDIIFKYKGFELSIKDSQFLRGYITILHLKQLEFEKIVKKKGINFIKKEIDQLIINIKINDCITFLRSNTFDYSNLDINDIQSFCNYMVWMVNGEYIKEDDNNGIIGL